jgi:hypothetical protein
VQAAVLPGVLSAVSASLSAMTYDDVVDPADAALNDLLAHLAESSSGSGKRAEILDMMLTVPPIAAWPSETLQELYEVCSWVGLRHRLEQGGASF